MDTGTSQLDHVNAAMLCRRLLAFGQMGGYIVTTENRRWIFWSDTSPEVPVKMRHIVPSLNSEFCVAGGVLEALDRVDTWLVAAGHPPLAEWWDEGLMPIY